MDISRLQHTPFYCEENVYLLCKELCTNGTADATGSDLFVAFISNEKKQVPLWNQKASKRADGAILWDYHVICVQRKNNGSPHLVWDLDSALPFPSPLASYVSETIRPSFQLFSEYQSLFTRFGPVALLPHCLLPFYEKIEFFRIVHAPVFLRCFASDRRHMKDSVGNWIAEPPAYEPIVAEDGTVHNLNEYIEIQASDAAKEFQGDLMNDVNQKFGVLINENQIEEFFSKLS
ncbi:protein N-terminal glutamine amidohydrolase isoform X1 [Carica papaya]|uniref:protein N-terminal glutamine amidohydrolase isoform X1 n=1 Tax=Carica papaya TaxID=3649 RepID=UPI000B8D0438|nr:protein N-terminal glutamine amidohydrolase isoform X1 [Carica papaya]